MRYRVLCVDDQEDVIEIAETCLSLDSELDVRSCRSGSQALIYIENWLPDLVLMDVMMPDMDGPETMRRMAERPETAGIPIAFLTGHSDLESTSDLIRLGAVAVISKPFQLRLLAGQVRSILERRA